jgi:cytosine deaminase
MLVGDTDDANSRSLEYLAVKTLREGYGGRVSNAHISMVLTGRRDRERLRRGITRVRELLGAGVNVASGRDDVTSHITPRGSGGA